MCCTCRGSLHPETQQLVCDLRSIRKGLLNSVTVLSSIPAAQLCLDSQKNMQHPLVHFWETYNHFDLHFAVTDCYLVGQDMVDNSIAMVPFDALPAPPEEDTRGYWSAHVYYYCNLG